MKHKIPPDDVINFPRDVPPPFLGKVKEIVLLRGSYPTSIFRFAIEKVDHVNGQDMYEFTIHLADPKQKQRSEFVLHCSAQALIELRDETLKTVT
jgi:hypothetical protein